MDRFHAYVCSACGASFSPSTQPRYACDGCGGEALDVEPALASEMRKPSASDPSSLWRYTELLPVRPPSPEHGPLFSLGMTPLHVAPRVARRAGVAEAWIKDDGALPTGSLKDRASAIVAMRARELGVQKLIAASTGNAGVAMAAMARAAGLDAVVLVPRAGALGAAWALVVGHGLALFVNVGLVARFGARSGAPDGAATITRAVAELT